MYPSGYSGDSNAPGQSGVWETLHERPTTRSFERPLHTYTCTCTNTHYRVGANTLQNDYICSHSETQTMILCYLCIHELNQETESPHNTHTHTDNAHIWGPTLTARVTLTHFIYIQNTLSPWCKYTVTTLPLTHSHPQSHKHTHIDSPETLTPSWGAGGWGIATTHFASMQPLSKQSGDT